MSSLKNKRARGVACYIKNDLNVELYDLNCKYDDAVWLKLKINKSSDTLLIGCVYRSPSNTPQLNKLFLEMFEEIATLNNNNVIVVGDFNFPGINWMSLSYNGNDNSPLKKSFIECIRDCYFIQIVEKSTRFRNESDNILDLIFVRDDMQISDLTFYNPLGKSDHVIIQFNYNVVIEKIDCMKTKYLFHKANYDAMRHDLLDIDWPDIFLQKNVQEQWDIFLKIYNNLMNKYLPKIEYNLLKMDQHDIPLSPDVVKLIKSKNTAWSKFMSTRKVKHHKKYTSY